MRILASLLLLLSTSAFAASGSGNVSEVVGSSGYSGNSSAGTPITGLTDLYISSSNFKNSGWKTLIASFTGSIAVDTWHHLVDPSNGSTQYQVPSGKTFSVSKVCMGVTATGGFNGALGSATATFTNATTSAPTGAQYFSGGVASARPHILSGQPAASSTLEKCFSVPFPSAFGSLTYPFFNTSSSSNSNYILVIGKEE